MKKILFFSLILLIGNSVFASPKKPIAENQLPVAVKSFITKFFSQEKIATAMYEEELFDKEYKIILTDGSKLEFDKKGNCKEIKCKKNAIPMNVLPKKISNYINTHYANQSVVEYQKDKREYEIKLQNGIELVFNKNGEFTHFD